MFHHVVCLWLALCALAVAQEARVVRQSQDFPKGAGPENVILRPSGAILTAIGTLPRIYQVDVSANAAPQLVHTFTHALGVSSIAASGLEPDVYYAITGNFSYATLTPTAGSYSIHRLSFDPSGGAVVKQLAFLDAIAQPNGMVGVPGTPFVLIADCYKGLVWRLDTRSLALTMYFDGPLLKPQPQDGFAFGVNGIKLSRGYLYFSNTNQELVGRVRATGLETRLQVTPQVLATQAPVDDFVVDGRNGDLYMAFNVYNELGYLAHDANSTVPTVILGGGNSTDVLGPTAAIWAKDAEGKELIVPVTGGFLQYVEQSFTGGARIETVRVGKYP